VPRRVAFQIIPLLVCLSLSPRAARAADDDKCKHADPDHVLLSGEPGLNYYEVGQAIANAFNKDRAPQDQLTSCPSDGSIENVQKLSKGEAAFALVQSDVAHSAWFLHSLHTVAQSPPCALSYHPFPPLSPKHHVLLIVPLFTETVHVLVRPHSYVSSVADLRGRSIWTGKEGAGGYLTAERVLAAAGLGMCDVKLIHAEDPAKQMDTVQAALIKLQSMDLDAVIFTGSAPTTAIQAAFTSPSDQPSLNPEISFLPLSLGMVTQLSRDASYVETMIRKDEYGPGNPNGQGITTVGVEAFLVASDDNANSDVAQSLVNFLAGNMDSVRQYIPKDERALARLDLVDAPTPAYLTPEYFLPLARASFYKDRWSFWRRAILWTAGIVIFLFALFCWKRKKIGPWLMKEPVLFFAFVGILVTWVAGSFTLWAYERHVNGDFTTVLRSLKSLAWYLLPWLARTPVTANGQTTATIIRYVMLALFGGAIWPFAKKFLVERIWRPLARWLRGGHLFARHNHSSR
jgi:TRAP transporter TAXI family solute receptor